MVVKKVAGQWPLWLMLTATGSAFLAGSLLSWAVFSEPVKNEQQSVVRPGVVDVPPELSKRVDELQEESAKPDVWPLPWEIVSIEATRGLIAEKRSARVVFPKPANEAALRTCVKQVYSTLRRDILESPHLDEQTGQVISVHVWWDRKEEQLSSQFSDTRWQLARLNISKPLPATIAEEAIVIHWRDPHSEPTAAMREIDFDVARLITAHTRDFRESRFPPKPEPASRALLEELTRFEERLDAQVYAEIAEIYRISDDAVRRAVQHVFWWQMCEPVTEELIAKSIAKEAERNKTK